MIVQNTYDELGKLTSKKVGGQIPTGGVPAGWTGFLQKVDYAYNIRGWLTNINDINNLSAIAGDPQDLFSFKINYNTVENQSTYIGKELYIGNISETYWRTKSDLQLPQSFYKKAFHLRNNVCKRGS